MQLWPIFSQGIEVIRVKNLHRVLSSTNTVRPEAVARAKRLVQDKNYPSRAVLERVAWMFSRVLCEQAPEFTFLDSNLERHTGGRNRVSNLVD